MRQYNAPIAWKGQLYVVVLDDHNSGSTWTGEVHLGRATGPNVHSEVADTFEAARQRCLAWIEAQ
jgi:hypothetical protein